MARDRSAVLGALAALGVLWVTFGLVLEPEKEGSCTTGLYPGTYADALVPAHLAVYLLLAFLIAWWRPPGRATRIGLAATAVVAAVSVVWPAPAVILGVVGVILAVPAGIAALIGLALFFSGRTRDPVLTASGLLWTAMLVGLPATLMGAYFNGAGLFCF